MADLKRCRQCGMLKDVEDFRKYTYSRVNDTEGRYSTCKSCESINTRLTKLEKNIADVEERMCTEFLDMSKYNAWQNERDDILKLYDALESRGLHTPRVGKAPAESAPATSLQVSKLLEFYDEKPSQCVQTYIPPVDQEVPAELSRWLAGTPEEWEEAGMSPEYLQETIYESLKAKYRRQTGVDQNTYLPIYDDSFKSILNDILRLFDDYEELIAGKEDTAEDTEEELR